MSKTPKTRIELHAHLDGCIRHETIWEIMNEKNKDDLPGDKSFRALRKALVVTKPSTLADFLKPFAIYMGSFVGDLVALERIAYEFCEDKSNDHVLYVEARYSPHGFLDQSEWSIDSLSEVVKAVNRGFARGEQDFNIKARTILCFLSPETAEDTLKLCENFRNDGVVGIDKAGAADEEVPLNTIYQKVYEQAAELGIHRTVHAGESGPAEMVRRAVEVYKTERVGHGYHVVDDSVVYQTCRDKDIHFECCPWSSLLTGSVGMSVDKHPIVQFSEDNVNFSLNTDDMTITGHPLSEDYCLTSTWGLTEAHFVRTNLNAARSCFLPDTEKQQLITQLKKNYGLE